MTQIIPRRPLYGEEWEHFRQTVRTALDARLTRANFLIAQVVEERDVLVYCRNPGGVPGKRYPYEPGWLNSFRQDLQELYFLAP